MKTIINDSWLLSDKQLFHRYTDGHIGVAAVITKLPDGKNAVLPAIDGSGCEQELTMAVRSLALKVFLQRQLGRDMDIVLEPTEFGEDVKQVFVNRIDHGDWRYVLEENFNRFTLGYLYKDSRPAAEPQDCRIGAELLGGKYEGVTPNADAEELRQAKEILDSMHEDSPADALTPEEEEDAEFDRLIDEDPLLCDLAEHLQQRCLRKSEDALMTEVEEDADEEEEDAEFDRLIDEDPQLRDLAECLQHRRMGKAATAQDDGDEGDTP